MKRKLRKILRNINYKNKIVLDLGTGLGSIKELSDLCENTTLVGLSDKHSFIESQKQMVKSNFLYVVGEYKMDNISIYPKNIRKVFDQYFENLNIKDINTNNKGHFITIIGGKE